MESTLTSPKMLEIGTFKIVRGAEYVDYLIKLGVPREKALVYLGTHWSTRISCPRKEENDNFVVVTTCEELPQLNRVHTCTLNHECELTDLTMLGCKTKVNFCRVSEGCYRGSEECCFLGSDSNLKCKVVRTETYSEEGRIVTCCSEDMGTGIREVWHRVVEERGFYKYAKGEGVEGFLKSCGLPVEATIAIKDCIVHFDIQGDTFVVTDRFGGICSTTRFRIDEETDYCFPSHPSYVRKFIYTRTGIGRFTGIGMGENGEREQRDFIFKDDGVEMIARDLKSGESCRVWFSRFTDVYGTFKPVSTCGFEHFGKALGLSPDLVSKTLSEKGAKLKIGEEKAGFVCCKFDSKCLPLDHFLQFGEEHECVYPGLSDRFRVLPTRKGSYIIIVSRGPRFTIKTTMHFTEHFMIQSLGVVGTDICAKIVFEKLRCSV